MFSVKKRRSVSIISLAVAVCIFCSGCKSERAEKPIAPAVSASKTAQIGKATRVFTDSAGRKVTVPMQIDSAAPSGPLAQIVLYTAAPEKLAGLAADFSTDAKKYVDKKYWSLPKFGQFYGKNASLNMEALSAAAPDVIIDIGEAKKTIRQDMDGLQKQIGIPTVFISATLNDLDKTYAMLGDLLGVPNRAARLSDYCKETIERADKIAESIPEKQKIRVYMATGNSGLSTNASGSIHADVLNRVGAINVAKIEVVSSGGGSNVSFEQILSWNPDVILADGKNLYQTITTDPVWKELKAVKNGKVYRIPATPYSFISNPPSVNRIIGINWLGNLLYPDRFRLDIKKEVKDFYDLFYSIALTDTQYEEITK